MISACIYQRRHVSEHRKRQKNNINEKQLLISLDSRNIRIASMALTQRVFDNSLHPCVTSERSLRVVPTYTRASVIGCDRNHIGLISSNNKVLY